MNVAKIELCKELSSLAVGWGDTEHIWNQGASSEWYLCTIDTLVNTAGDICPAYDLDYVVGKLPPKIEIRNDTYGLIITPCTSDGTWIVDYIVADWGQPLSGLKEQWLHFGDKAKLTEADTAANAAVMLAIQLLKQKILKKEET